MSDYSSFAGQRLVAVNLLLPLIGLWTADVVCADGQTLPSTGQMTHGNLTVQGAVFRQGTLGGQTRARIAAGFGGWSKQVGAKGYQSPFGVLLSLVLSELAAEVGEQVNVATLATLGNFWHRSAGPAGKALRAAAGASWWVDNLGIMQITPRPAGSVTGPFQVEQWDAGAGIMTIAADDVASWQPGATFANEQVPTQTISAVRHVARNDGWARMRVMVTP